MKALLRKLFKIVAYLMAGLVIVLAIAVGIFRLMLPRLPEYQEEIKDWASAAIGMRVDFSGMTARWRLSGPELTFFDAALNRMDSGDNVVTAEEVSVGVGLMRLIADRELVVDRVSINDTEIDIRMSSDGEWLVQNMEVNELLGSRDMSTAPSGDIVIVARNVDVRYEHPGNGQLVPFTIGTLRASRDDDLLGLEAIVELPDDFGNRLEISANQLPGVGGRPVWRYFIEGDSLVLPGWSRLQPVGYPVVESGTADLSLWIDIGPSGVTSATVNTVISDLQVIGPSLASPFGLQGNIEYAAEPGGWFIAANQFRLDTADGNWPASDMQLRVTNDLDGTLSGIRASASYVNLDDLRYLVPWVPQDHRDTLLELAPSGILRGVGVDLIDLQGDELQFDITADLENAGFAAAGERPGIDNFSGRIRADRSGGRVEIASIDLGIDLGEQLPEALRFDDALGTIIWRRNRDGIIVLSDSVSLQNQDLFSDMSLQVGVPADDQAPYIDFESTWQVFDVSRMHRYLPVKYIMPNLRQWLTDALVAGEITGGTTRFTGSLDEFPFEGGEGVFRVDARLENAVLRYSPKWPAPEFRHLDIVVDNMRLYSTENSAVNLGNSVEDARIEIPDLRKPVLAIEAFATGSLKSIKDYATQSPINDVLGGQLDRVTVDGDASFDLAITYPIQDKENYDFRTRIRASNGMIRVAGFPAPVTELNGVVGITRNSVSSESLFGKFLGEPVDLQLSRQADPLAPHGVVLDARGRASALALDAELGLPLDGIAWGDAEFSASVRFPNIAAPTPGALSVVIDSDLYGFASDLPAPLGKADDVELPLQASIEFPSSGDIVTTGSLADIVNWTTRVVQTADGWDLDRGVLAFGGDYPGAADVRGLHIAGQVAEVDLQQWLSVARRETTGAGLGDRIRSIDIGVAQFDAIGQRFLDHRLEVNRSGQDWLIRISGAEADGTITVPYDFAAGRPITLDMARLILPGNDEEGDAAAPLDPRALPPISIAAGEFGLGERFFGQLQADFEKNARGLESANLKTIDPSFTIEGSAGWIIDPYEETGQRTYVNAVLKSSEIRRTMQRLGYEPGVSGNDMEVNFDIGWAGGPGEDFMSKLNGTVDARLGPGSLEDVEPGAGRVFGLMSIVALPRRLSLDFSDVFDTGFGFDQIIGTFRLVNGDAFTCNLTLTGPAADVGIVGRTSLPNRDYEQAAVVSANVGNTLPVVGGVLAGPQVAAALLVFSQIFKKPLQEMGQVYYTIEGSWDEPGIDSANTARFAEVSSLAGCIDARP